MASPFPALGWKRCCQQKGKVRGWLLLCWLWGVCSAVGYRDVFSRGGGAQWAKVFSKVIVLPNPLRGITPVDLIDAISFKIAQGFAQCLKLSSAFPFLPVPLYKTTVFLSLHYCLISVCSLPSHKLNPQQCSEFSADEYQWGECLDWSVLVSAGVLSCLFAFEAL